MNLALADVRHGFLRFFLTMIGVGFLIMAATGMIGLYRGIVDDALLIVERIGADLWVVQGGRAGPFSESSAIASDVDRRCEGVPGVASVRRFVQISRQFSFEGRTLRAAVTGLDFPTDRGDWLTLTSGRRLVAGHFEAIADESVGLHLGARVRLARDDFTIVGTTRGMVDASGDGLLFVTVADASTIAQKRSGEEILLARAAAGRTAAAGPTGSSVQQDSKISAVLLTLAPGAEEARVRATVLAWGDVDVLSRSDQRTLLLDQRLWRLRLQILAFTGVLLVVMTIVISLIIYMLTMEKLHQIAMLKLIGARNSVIVAMILQQSFLIGAGALVLGFLMSHLVFPHFPRRVLIEPADFALLSTAVGVVCGFAGLLGISRALRVRAQEVLS
ncbi:MAG: ABC transporter permease [Hyphomicrobiales bacterium]|nr:ABC transporter permease [Hyphomicrobiales bacterium]